MSKKGRTKTHQHKCIAAATITEKSGSFLKCLAAVWAGFFVCVFWNCLRTCKSEVIILFWVTSQHWKKAQYKIPYRALLFIFSYVKRKKRKSLWLTKSVERKASNLVEKSEEFPSIVHCLHTPAVGKLLSDTPTRCSHTPAVGKILVTILGPVVESNSPENSPNAHFSTPALNCSRPGDKTQKNGHVNPSGLT